MELTDVAPSFEVLQDCTRLAALQRLRLRACHFDDAAAAALFACCQQLTSLDLECYHSAVFRLHGLRLLAQLKRLYIADYSYALPQELVQAPTLETLDVSACALLELGQQDVNLLCRLPRLRELGLPGADPTQSVEEEEEDWKSCN
ncbi:toll-like receptor 4 [Chlorella sorokiniana]|uniref:Toll-like receptor 4 n=1 Tax=Chlorella sorokiniana TaxID=3076 RepID=A0A2P6TB60_CHLSO|nr:toll-like receptor 4 [Chlorella sorokiniana]|eukprot:PRW05789.1 toll-like receptor 4 [Chlorella sorokiniana]